MSAQVQEVGRERERVRRQVMTTLLLMMLIAGRQMLKLKTKTSFLSIFFGSIFKRAFFRPVAGEISLEGAGNRDTPPATTGD